MSDGSEFQMCKTATENARQTRSVCVLKTAVGRQMTAEAE